MDGSSDVAEADAETEKKLSIALDKEADDSARAEEDCAARLELDSSAEVKDASAELITALELSSKAEVADA